MEKIISSHNIEDSYLTQIVSVCKILRISSKSKRKIDFTLSKHKILANRMFDNQTKKDLFAKAYGFQNMYVEGFTFEPKSFVTINSVWT